VRVRVRHGHAFRSQPAELILLRHRDLVKQQKFTTGNFQDTAACPATNPKPLVRGGLSQRFSYGETALSFVKKKKKKKDCFLMNLPYSDMRLEFLAAAGKFHFQNLSKKKSQRKEKNCKK
jgi:hypothetical protein